MNDAMNHAMNGQVFRSGKPVTARGIVSAVIAGDVSPGEAVEMIEWLIEVSARDTHLRDTKPDRTERPARRQT